MVGPMHTRTCARFRISTWSKTYGSSMFTEIVTLSLSLLAAPRPVILDVDPGIDDALAILLAVRSPELDVRAITFVFGNVELELGVSNALKLLELAGRSDIPVGRGEAAPLLREPLTAKNVHGEN